jgi:hypothetical protein
MSDPSLHAAPLEVLFDWEVPAINTPANAGPEELAGFLADPGSIASAAVWVRATIAYTVFGRTLNEAFAAKVDAFLAAWRNRHGREKLEELKQQVLEENVKRTLDPQRKEAVRQAVEQFYHRADP